MTLSACKCESSPSRINLKGFMIQTYTVQGVVYRQFSITGIILQLSHPKTLENRQNHYIFQYSAMHPSQFFKFFHVAMVGF
jgi:hypothetical protein